MAEKRGTWAAYNILRDPLCARDEPPSLWRDCVPYVLNEILKYSDYPIDFPDTRGWLLYSCNALEFSNMDPKPWNISDDAERKQLTGFAGAEFRQPTYNSQTNYTRSVAAQALRFLYAMPNTARASIRGIRLKENCESMAHPECHGRGFIMLCQKNPKLRVRRFANLW
jgi:hypothetical protein